MEAKFLVQMGDAAVDRTNFAEDYQAELKYGIRLMSYCYLSLACAMHVRVCGKRVLSGWLIEAREGGHSVVNLHFFLSYMRI